MRQFYISFAFMIFMTNAVMAQNSVWKSDNLNRLEVHSLYELIKITSGWTFATNDDATIQYARNGLSGTGGVLFPIYLDGVQLNLQHWNSVSLHSIPVSVTQIDSIVIVGQPQLLEGEFNERGGIYIYSQKPDEGFRFQANTVIGNRSGDPGPFVYTNLASRNIERLGPVSDATISFSKNKFNARVGFKQFVHAVTDPLQFRRLTPYEFGEGPHRHEKIRSNSAFVQSELQSGIFNHQFVIGATEATDFLFTGLYGTEIPVDRNWYFYSATGDAKLHQKWRLRYSIGRNSTNLTEYPNKEDRWLRWNQTITNGSFYLKHIFENGEQKVGLNSQYFALEDEKKTNSTLKNQILKFSHSFTYTLSEKLSINSDLQAVSGNNWAVKGAGGFKFRLTQNHRLELDATYAERLPEEENSLWFWMFEKGFASDTLYEFYGGNLPNKSILKKGKLSWKSVYNDISYEISAVFSKMENEYLLDYALVPTGQRIETGSSMFLSDVDASFIQFPIRAEIKLYPEILTILNYTWSRQLDRDSELFAMMPEHRFMINVNWLPEPTFKVWARFQAQSSVYWNEAEEIDELEVRINPLQQDYYYFNSKSHFQIDFGIRKSFWEKRLAFSLKLENINNQYYRNHPVSPQHAFTVYLGMHFNI